MIPRAHEAVSTKDEYHLSQSERRRALTRRSAFFIQITIYFLPENGCIQPISFFDVEE
jgi:hypothetical protein